jgi:hypothetical protein
MHIPPRWQPALRVLILLAIFSMAGPEIIPAIEMATLLELLGTLLFITAFSTALKMTAIDFGRWLGNVLVPAPILAMYRETCRPLKKAEIILWLSGQATILLATVIPVGFLVKHLVGG